MFVCGYGEFGVAYTWCTGVCLGVGGSVGILASPEEVLIGRIVGFNRLSGWILHLCV